MNNVEEKERLERVWTAIREHLDKGIKKKDIPLILNEAGHRTRKGKAWSYQTLLLEIRRREEKPQDASSVEAEGGPSVPDSAPLADPAVDVVPLASRLVDEGHDVEGLLVQLNRFNRLDPQGKPWQLATLNAALADHLLDGDLEQGPVVFELGSGPLADQLDRAPFPEVLDPKVSVDEAWDFICEEVSKGVKKKALVGKLNLAGYLTRRSKPWSYPVLMQEIGRRKKDGQELPTRKMVLTREPEDGRLFQALGLARDRVEDIVEDLNERGYRTPKGKKWIYPVLLLELMRKDLHLEK